MEILYNYTGDEKPGAHLAQLAQKSYSRATRGGRTSKAVSDNVTRRVLSARKLKISEMRNEIEDMHQQIADLKLENKTLKRLQAKQDRELQRFEDKESDLPQLIKGHADEVRTLREQIKKLKEKSSRTEKKLREAEDDVTKTKKQLKKLEDLSHDKKLGERDDLNRKLAKAENELEEKTKRCQDLEKHVEILKKAQRHEVAVEINKHKETQKQLLEMRDMYERLKESYREKEKELEIKNIYSNRIVKPPHKLPSSETSPLASPPSGGRNKKKKQPSNDNSPSISPRDKAKQFNDRRRDRQHSADSVGVGDENKEKRKAIEAAGSSKRAEPLSSPDQSAVLAKPKEDDKKVSFDFSTYDDSLETDKHETKDGNDGIRQERREREEREYQDKEEHERKKREERNSREREERERRDREESDRRDKYDHDKVNREQDEQKEQSKRLDDDDDFTAMLRAKKEKANREREDREKREREEEERRLDREKKERADKERIEREKLEREEREKQEKEAIERRAREERERLANDTKAQEERRRKDLLLAKLKAMDEGASPPAASGSPGNTRKNSLTGSGGGFSPGSSRKTYTFTKPVENMHNGKPSHHDMSDKNKKQTKPKASFLDDDNETGGYTPSAFSSRNKDSSATSKKTSLFEKDNPSSSKSPSGSKAHNKANLMDELFGGGKKPATKSSFGEDDIFSSSTKAKPVSDKKAYPWESEVSTAGGAPGGQRKRESSNIIGGGTGLFDEDIGSPNNTNSPLLPRRQRQEASTFNAKPAVNAVDDIEDIEEVIL
ncbi:lebercilin isoform X5 [Lingula anatina]|uniref:Lebercilin isoform X5 n=1 Tax=Lingula anatina TaxID=7574 RepID=A0A1S3IZ48_LINAN|nr:lebercilin isoform X5 [Lingula anatina]|eukprot:XP_013403261.1 lebercilin isoform X5 [Lingula anatina]